MKPFSFFPTPSRFFPTPSRKRSFKKPYQVALAGGLAAAAGGLAAGAILSLWRTARGKKPLSPLALAAGAFAAGGCFAGRYFPPYSRRRPARGQVYLTFDDGPDPEVTPQILDALAAHGAFAAFFLLGENVLKQPTLVRRIAHEGHAIGIHGFDHEPVTFQSPRRIGQSLDQCLAAILAAVPGKATRPAIRYYRPPYGLRGPGVGAAIHQRRLRLALWTLDSHDYLLRSPDRIRHRLADHLLPGDIVLLHDAGETGLATALALPVILQEIANRGWKAIPLE